MDYMSQLLAIGEGGQAFFVSCLLHLSPEDLKACRLVNKTWNKVIKERVWGNKRARKRLEEKLLNRWKTTNPETVRVRLGTVPWGVGAIFSNNLHVFCGMRSGNVKVYNLADGQWVRDLESGEETLEVTGICGNESIVAAQLRARVVTIWSSKDEMGRLHSFDVRNNDGMEVGWVDDIKVAGNKVVLLLTYTDGTRSTHQLVVLQEGEHNWENKILEPFSTPVRRSRRTTSRSLNKLAVDKDWLAFAVKDVSIPGILKVKLWKEELFRQDIELPLPGVSAGDVKDVVLESPFLVVGGRSWSDDRWIKVFQLAADKHMEVLNTAAPLIKTVQFPGFYPDKLLCTGLVWGCLLRDENYERSLVPFEKAALLGTATLPEETERNMILLEATYHNFVDMYTTGLVFIQKGTVRGNQEQVYLCKKDFWISNAVA